MNPHILASRLKFLFIALVGAAIFILGTVYFFFFAAPGGDQKEFVVPRGMEQSEIIRELKAQGFIRNELGLRFARKIVNPLGEIRAGGYALNKNSNAFSLARTLNRPNEKWVVIFEGVRREEVAETFGDALSWNKIETQAFLSYDSPTMFGLTEGVYFPDTYLVPTNESGANVAKLLVSHLNEKLNPHIIAFTTARIKINTALNIASLVQRETADTEEMSLIAGIIWNRLNQNMKLDIDASVQYARGKAGKGWWAPIKSQDKNIDSPYNTYKYGGLPPGPISNPGIDAILAVLNPKKTDCLFYLHDSEKKIHCAKTYNEHLKNVQLYITKK